MEERTGVPPKKGIPLLMTNYTRAEAEAIINDANDHLKYGGRKEILEKYHIGKWDLLMLAKAYGLELKRMRKRFASDDDKPLQLGHNRSIVAARSADVTHYETGEVKPRKRRKKIWRRHGKYSAEGYKRLVLAARRNARKRRAMTPGAQRLLAGVTAKTVAPKWSGGKAEIAFQVADLEKRLAIAESFRKEILAIVSK